MRINVGGEELWGSGGGMQVFVWGRRVEKTGEAWLRRAGCREACGIASPASIVSVCVCVCVCTARRKRWERTWVVELAGDDWLLVRIHHWPHGLFLHAHGWIHPW